MRFTPILPLFFLSSLFAQNLPSPPAPLNNAKTYQESGWEKYKKEDYEGALKDLGQSIELAPADIDSYLMRTRIRLKLKDKKGAWEDYGKVIELDPGTGYFERSLHRYIIENDEKGGLEDMAKAIEYKPEMVVEYGADLAERGMVERSESILKKFIEIRPKDSIAYYVLGRLYFETEKYAEAQSHLRKALDLELEGPAADGEERVARKRLQGSYHKHLGRVLEHTGKLEDAIAQYKSSIEAYPADAWEDLYYACERKFLLRHKLSSEMYEKSRRVKEVDEEYAALSRKRHAKDGGKLEPKGQALMTDPITDKKYDRLNAACALCGEGLEFYFDLSGISYGSRLGFPSDPPKKGKVEAALVKTLKDKDPDLRYYSIQALASEMTSEQLKSRLLDPDRWIQASAVWAVEKADKPDLWEALKQSPESKDKLTAFLKESILENHENPPSP